MAFSAADAKKEEFQRYLESSGVVESITKVLVSLYELPEKPPNAIDYIKDYLGAPTSTDTEALIKKNEALTKALADKDAEIKALKAQLAAAQAGLGQSN